MLYLAQITQSMGQKTETEFYRRLMDKFSELDGTGHNMGALYWQLNDVAPFCSWASIGIHYKLDVLNTNIRNHNQVLHANFMLLEYNGRWKMHHYYAKTFFAPYLPSPYRERNGDVVIELISDTREQLFKQMRVRVFKTDSMVALIEDRNSVTAVRYIHI
jgi:beta-mannosidase